jgi:hypothetical protein
MRLVWMLLGTVLAIGCGPSAGTSSSDTSEGGETSTAPTDDGSQSDSDADGGSEQTPTTTGGDSGSTPTGSENGGTSTSSESGATGVGPPTVEECAQYEDLDACWDAGCTFWDSHAVPIEPGCEEGTPFALCSHGAPGVETAPSIFFRFVDGQPEGLRFGSLHSHLEGWTLCAPCYGNPDDPACEDKPVEICGCY